MRLWRHLCLLTVWPADFCVLSMRVCNKYKMFGLDYFGILRGEKIMRSTIICVDDEKMLLNMLYEQLNDWFGENYTIEKASNATDALKILDAHLSAGEDVSVFISDYIMPITKGDELLTLVKERDPKIKRIMLTGYSAIDGIINAINKAGIYRYISKPWDNKDLMLTLLEAIKSYEQDKITSKLSKNYETLYYKYEKLYNESDEKYNELLNTIASICDNRAKAKENRSLKIADYCELMGTLLNLKNEELKVLVSSAMLFDIGKLEMSESAIDNLSKCDKYSDSYIQLNFQQAAKAEKILGNIKNSDELIKNIKYQYESYDGTGPFKLKGEEIPLGARIIHIAALYYEILAAHPDKSHKEIIMEFITTGKTFLDTKLTSMFVKNINTLE